MLAAVSLLGVSENSAVKPHKGLQIGGRNNDVAILVNDAGQSQAGKAYRLYQLLHIFLASFPREHSDHVIAAANRNGI